MRIKRIRHSGSPLLNTVQRYPSSPLQTVQNLPCEISQFFSDTFTQNSIELYTKGTDSHLLLLNLRKHNLTGKYCEDMLLNQHILTNRNQVPNDNFIASVASGLRIGILTLATLDMPQSEYSIIASIIAETILKGKIIDTTTVSQIMKYYKIIDN